MSGISNSALAAVKRRLAEEERQRKEQEAWKATPAGQHGASFGARLEPWILGLADSLSTAGKTEVIALHVTRQVLNDKEDPFEWPCGRGEFEATLYRFPKGTVEEGFASSPFLAGCRCPAADAWSLTIGIKPDREGMLAYGLLPGVQQFWFTPAPLGDPGEAVHYYDGSRDHDQIGLGEMVVQVTGVRDDAAPHPCSLGGFSLDHATNFFFPLRNAEALFNATLEGFFRGEPLVPQFARRPPEPAR
jgi:hypothetical protein